MNIFSFLTSCRDGKITESFRDTLENLQGIRSKLEKLSLIHNWSLRQIDLYEYERQLVAIDEARVDGQFVDAEGNPGDIFMQRVSNITSEPFIRQCSRANACERHFYMSYAKVMLSYTNLLSPPSPSQKRCFPSITN